jgi:hypothetical protein
MAQGPPIIIENKKRRELTFLCAFFFLVSDNFHIFATRTIIIDFIN